MPPGDTTANERKRKLFEITINDQDNVPVEVGFDTVEELNRFISQHAAPAATTRKPITCLKGIKSVSREFDILVEYGLDDAEDFTLSMPHDLVSTGMPSDIVEYLDKKSPSEYLQRNLDFHQAITNAGENEATCRMRANFILYEAMGILKGRAQAWDERQKQHQHQQHPAATASTRRHQRRETPTPFTQLKLTGETDLVWTCDDTNTKYTGRLDWTINIERGSIPSARNGGMQKPYMTNILLIVEGKREGTWDLAGAQLTAYMSCLYRARIKARKRADCTTYGLATDGKSFQFMAITHDGLLQQSKLIRTDNPAGLREALKFLVWVLWTTLGKLTPHSTPHKVKESKKKHGESQEQEDESGTEVLGLVIDESDLLKEVVPDIEGEIKKMRQDDESDLLKEGVPDIEGEIKKMRQDDGIKSEVEKSIVNKSIDIE